MPSKTPAHPSKGPPIAVVVGDGWVARVGDPLEYEGCLPITPLPPLQQSGNSCCCCCCWDGEWACRSREYPVLDVRPRTSNIGGHLEPTGRIGSASGFERLCSWPFVFQFSQYCRLVCGMETLPFLSSWMIGRTLSPPPPKGNSDSTNITTTNQPA